MKIKKMNSCEKGFEVTHYKHAKPGTLRKLFSPFAYKTPVEVQLLGRNY